MFKSKLKIDSDKLTVVLLLILAIAALAAKIFFPICWVPTESMMPTLQIGEVVFTTRIWDEGDVERGDIVSFKDDAGTLLIKRLIGQPGDTIEIRDGILYLNDVAQDESYIKQDFPTNDFGPYTVPEGEYFMMGDNRNNSADSRFFGSVSFDRLRFKAYFHFTSRIFKFVADNIDPYYFA